MATLSTARSRLQHRWQLVLVFAFILGTFLLVSTAESAGKKSSAADLRGIWDLSWKGAVDTYTGTLTVVDQLDANIFSGTIVIINSKGATVTQDATLHVKGASITINCTNASKSPYYNDNFYVTLNGKVMTGHSVDSAGQMGSLIKFKKR